MKKLVSLLFILLLSPLLSIVVYAGPPLVSIEYEDFTDFEELVHMVGNATDGELDVFLNGNNSIYRDTGIDDRDSALEFIQTIGHALIPVLSDSRNIEWRINIPRGDTDYTEDAGMLHVNFWYPGRSSIHFFSYYGGYDLNHALRLIELYGFNGFENEGIIYHQLSEWYDFVIFIDDYILFSNHYDRESPEEKAEEVLRFSFERLDVNENEDNSVSAIIRIIIIVSILISFIILIFLKKVKRK